MEQISNISEAKKFNAKRLPIIEFAFEDMRILKQIQKIIKPKQGAAAAQADNQSTDVLGKLAAKAGHTTKIGKDTTDEDLEGEIEKRKRREELQKKKKEFENDKQVIKLRMEEYQQTPAKATKEAVMHLMKLARSHRGLKQRIKKKFPDFFKDEPEQDPVFVSKNGLKKNSNQGKDKQNGSESRSGSQKPQKQRGEGPLDKRKPDFSARKQEAEFLKKEEQKLMNQSKNKRKQFDRKNDSKDRLDVAYLTDLDVGRPVHTPSDEQAEVDKLTELSSA